MFYLPILVFDADKFPPEAKATNDGCKFLNSCV